MCERLISSPFDVDQKTGGSPGLLESRDVPGPGDTRLRVDADEAAEALVAAQLGEDGLGGDVSQATRKTTTAQRTWTESSLRPLAAGSAEQVEQIGVGQCGEEILDGS